MLRSLLLALAIKLKKGVIVAYSLFFICLFVYLSVCLFYLLVDPGWGSASY